MTISDLINQLTSHMKTIGPGAQVKIGSAYGSIENPFNAFRVVLPPDSKEVFLMPDDVWVKSDLAGLARREQHR